MRKAILPGDIFIFYNGDYSGKLIVTAPAGDERGSRVEAQCTFAQLLKFAIDEPGKKPGDVVQLGQDVEAGRPGISVPMKTVYQFLAQAFEGQLISVLQHGVAPATREGVLALMQLKGVIAGMNQDNKPGPEHVDYQSAEWALGYEEGKAGHPHNARHPEDTQAWFNYHEGWLMGDFEGKSNSPGA